VVASVLLISMNSLLVHNNDDISMSNTPAAGIANICDLEGEGEYRVGAYHARNKTTPVPQLHKQARACSLYS
jgi:hypothetical protein